MINVVLLLPMLMQAADDYKTHQKSQRLDSELRSPKSSELIDHSVTLLIVAASTRFSLSGVNALWSLINFMYGCKSQNLNRKVSVSRIRNIGLGYKGIYNFYSWKCFVEQIVSLLCTNAIVFKVKAKLEK